MTLISVDSDLHLNIDNKTFLSAKPLNDGCFGYIWAGARATHGISSGKVSKKIKPLSHAFCYTMVRRYENVSIGWQSDNWFALVRS